ncbi:ABC transporter permease [Xinfangfangia sp. CPCC 101601]|uniref:ABC transporter permease n=1 Tax=Pseudogemmobacter lacusdianii TaxID=3069608 RepID=A0ABU0W0X7_9RHOB|nr:ABC transporter permease [Xinfangfangia sp. CPCC 101601]MDQ2067619.1 ABC transporter permease [Xinfangfangia sp. CPCC 101601]
MSSAADPLPRKTLPLPASLRRLMADRMGAAGAFIVLFLLAIAIIAPWIAPYDPLKINVKAKLLAPSWEHWAGTDHLGRDTLSRLILGTRNALWIALTATGLAGVIGMILGLIAGYGPRWIDGILVLLLDSLSSLPMIMFALAVITVLGPGTQTLMLVIVLVSIPGYARLIRAQVLTLKNADFIQAERVMGASLPRILLVHLLPNVVGPLVIVLSMDVPVVIMLEAGLSYLNLGVKPPEPSWGNMLYDGYTSLRQQPSLVIAAGIPLILATLGFTFLGEGLRDALDPKLQKRLP